MGQFEEHHRITARAVYRLVDPECQESAAPFLGPSPLAELPMNPSLAIAKCDNVVRRIYFGRVKEDTPLPALYWLSLERLVGIAHADLVCPSQSAALSSNRCAKVRASCIVASYQKKSRRPNELPSSVRAIGNADVLRLQQSRAHVTILKFLAGSVFERSRHRRSNDIRLLQKIWSSVGKPARVIHDHS